MGWTPRVGDPVLYKGDRGIVTDVVTHSSDADCSVGLDMGSKKLQTFSAVELTLHVEPGQWWERTKTGVQYVVEPEPQSPEPGLYRLRRLDTTQLLEVARSVTELTSLFSGPDWKHVPADKSYKERVVPERGDVDEQPKWVPRLNDPVRSHDGKAGRVVKLGGRVVKLGDWRVAVQWGGLDGFEWLPDASRLALDIAHGQWWENTSTKNVYRVTMARDGQQLVNLHSGRCLQLQGANYVAVIGEPNWMLVKDVDRGSLLASAAADSGAAALLRASSPSGEQPEAGPIPAPGQFWRRGAAVVELLQQANNEDGDARYWVARYVGPLWRRIAHKVQVDLRDWTLLTPDEQRDVWQKTVKLLDDLNEYALGRGSATMPTVSMNDRDYAIEAAVAEGRLRLREGAGISDAALDAMCEVAATALRRPGTLTVMNELAELAGGCRLWSHKEIWVRTVLGRYLRESIPELAKAAELACAVDSAMAAGRLSNAASVNDAAIRFEAAGVARTPRVGDVYTRDGLHVRLTKQLDHLPAPDGYWEGELESAWVTGSVEDGFDLHFGQIVAVDFSDGWSYVPPADVATMRRRSLATVVATLAVDIEMWDDRFPGLAALPLWTSGRQRRVFTDLAQRVWVSNEAATKQAAKQLVAVWAATGRALADAPACSWTALRDRVGEAVRPVFDEKAIPLVDYPDGRSGDFARDWAILVVGQLMRCPRDEPPEQTEEKLMDVQEYVRLKALADGCLNVTSVREDIHEFCATLAARRHAVSTDALAIAIRRALAIRVHALYTNALRPPLQALVEAALPHTLLDVDALRRQPLMLDQKEHDAILAFEERQVAILRAYDDERCVAVTSGLIEQARDGLPVTLPELERQAGDSARARALVEAFWVELQANKWTTITASEQEQETTMSKVKEQAGLAWDTLKDEGTEAAWNTVAIKAIDWGKGLVVGMAAKYIDPKDKTLKGKLTRALNTEGGAMVVSFALSGAVALFGSQVAPVLGIGQGQLSYLGERLRVMGMTKGGVAVVDGVLSQLKAKAGPLVMLLKAMPAMPSNGALPGNGALRLSPDEAPVREKAR